MNGIKRMAAIGTVWLAILAGSAQAFIVDWTKLYIGTVLQSQTEGQDLHTRIYQNIYDWNRSVQFWQSFNYARPFKTLSAISLELQYAKAGSSADLNVYEGLGVQGRLISSTKVEWITDSGGGWHSFKLDAPVPLEDKPYTFALENLSSDDAIGVVVLSSRQMVHHYMQQGYFGMTKGVEGYARGTHKAAINYILLE